MTTDEIRVRLKQVAQRRSEAASVDRVTADELHGAVLEALAAGIGPTEIANITGIARSRVYQIKDGK